MISLSVLRRLLRYAARCGQVSKGTPEVLQQLNDELLEAVAARAGEIARDGRIDVPDVVAAWKEKVIFIDDDDEHGGGPMSAFDSPLNASLAPRPLTENKRHIYAENPTIKRRIKCNQTLPK